MSTDELVAVIDKDGNTLEYIPRSKLGPQHTWKIISVWIENSHGQVLIQQRSLKKELGPGLWTCAVEGTVEKDDSYLETAKREVVEEIGLTDFTLIPAKKVLYRAEKGSRLAQGYRIMTDWPIERFTLQKEEVEQLKWVDKKKFVASLKSDDPELHRFPRAGRAWLEMFDLN